MLVLKGGEPLPKSVVIPTPSFGLNHVLGGGFWTGRFSLMWGNPSSGKTTFLLHVLANAQEFGYTPVIIDAEGSYTDEWATKCGIDLDERIYIKSNIWEDMKGKIVPLMKEQKCLILFDSLNAIASKSFYDDKDGMAGGARIRRAIFQELGEYLHPSDNGILMVSQQTLDFTGQYPRMSAKIGNAEHHWCTNIIRLFGSSAKDSLERGSNELIENKEIRWTIEKSKQSPIEGTVGTYWFNPQNALINTKKEIILIAIANGVILKKGSWFTYDGTQYHGMDKLSDEISDEQVEKITCELNNIELVFEVEDGD